MRRFSLAFFCLVVISCAGWAAFDRVRSAGSPTGGAVESVLVVLVDDRAAVAAMRAASDPTRILVATSDVVAFRDGRVFATDLEAAAWGVEEAGFSGRSVIVRRPGRRPPA
jgi:hypothetical protein